MLQAKPLDLVVPCAEDIVAFFHPRLVPAGIPAAVPFLASKANRLTRVRFRQIFLS
jgi:hypothetical protein